MKSEILAHLEEPDQLEKLYRSNKSMFRRTFNTIYPEVKGTITAEFWFQRLNYEGEEINWGNRKDIWWLAIAVVVAGLLAKLPAILGLNEEFYYSRNVGFIVFPMLTAYFAYKSNLNTRKTAFIAIAFLAGLIFINLLPLNNRSDTVILSCIHLVLYLWCLLGYAFVGKMNEQDRKLSFLKFNGDLVVISALIIIAGGIMTAITIGLFSLIGLNIEKFYFENIVIAGLPAVPLLGTFLIQTNPQLVGKVSPVIAKIFSPLVLVMLVIYLLAMIYSGKDPYNNRDFLLMFNALLAGVLAIIFFSIAGTPNQKGRVEIGILFLLSAITIIVNGIALSAILFRINEWGITPNRLAVLGGNIIILLNLLVVTTQLYKRLFKQDGLSGITKAIVYFLPAYFVWTIIVTFLFPFLFGFK